MKIQEVDIKLMMSKQKDPIALRSKCSAIAVFF